jgi:hypothetical protein
MVTEVAKAYYPRAVAAADAARTRAQAGYTIASAVAAALVAAGVFGDFEQLPTEVQVLGVVALAAWLVAAFAFMLAVSTRRPTPGEQEDPTKPQQQKGSLAFVTDVMGDTMGERAAVEKVVGIATAAVGVAMLLTLATIVGVAADEDADPKRDGVLILTVEGIATSKATCDREMNTIEGRFDPAKLKDEFVSLVVSAGDCTGEDIDLRFRKKEIAAARLVNAD